MKFSNIRFIDSSVDSSGGQFLSPYITNNSNSFSSHKWYMGSNSLSATVLPSEISEISVITKNGNIMISGFSGANSRLNGEWTFGVMEYDDYDEYYNFVEQSDSDPIFDSIPMENRAWRIYGDDYYSYLWYDYYYGNWLITDYLGWTEEGTYIPLDYSGNIPWDNNANSIILSATEYLYDYDSDEEYEYSYQIEISNGTHSFVSKVSANGFDSSVDGEYSLEGSNSDSVGRVFKKQIYEIKFNKNTYCWSIYNGDTILYNVSEPLGSGLTPHTAMGNIPDADDFIDDCLYVFRRKPSIARSSNTISPTDMIYPENSDWAAIGRSGEGYLLFNGNNTPYTTDSVISDINPEYITLTKKNGTLCVKSYSITPAYNESHVGNYNPEKWVLEGSNDSNSWSVIDSRDISWPSSDFNRRIFNIDNSRVGNYKTHRISISRTNSESDELSFRSLELYDNSYYEDGYYTMPNFGSKKIGITNFAFIGCPSEGDRFWNIIPDEFKSELISNGWTNDGNDYATICCSNSNSVNISINSPCRFYSENIDYIRGNNYITNVEQDSNNAKWIFNFWADKTIIDIRNCRFSSYGCNLDDERYYNQKPPMTCCGYLRASGIVDKLVFENNIVNYIPNTAISENNAYDGFRFIGKIVGASVSNNKFYMTKSDNDSWFYSNNVTSDATRFPKTAFAIISSTSSNGLRQSRFVGFNNNSLVIRQDDYYNMNSWVLLEKIEKIEFINNTVTEGSPMCIVDSNKMNMPLYKRDIITIGQPSNNTDQTSYIGGRTFEYCIKNFYADVPSIWGLYNCNFIRINFHDDDYDMRSGYNRSGKSCIIDNIVVKLGEGPSRDDISNSDYNKIISWKDGSEALSNAAIHISGKRFWEDEVYERYSSQPNVATNISSYNPWGTALKAYSIFAEAKNVRGKAVCGNCAMLKIENMSIKKAFGDDIKLSEDASAQIEIDNLLVEDMSLSNYVKLNSQNSGTIVVNKTNYKITSSNDTFSNSNCYNESMVVQKDIGDTHGFFLKTPNKFIESCSILHGNNKTLKMFGIYDSDRPLRFVDTGNSGLFCKDMLPGRYVVKINMAFSGVNSSSDLYLNTIISPSSNRKNVLLTDNLSIGIKTNNGELSVPDNVYINDDSNSGWDTSVLTPFCQEYYVDIYEPQTIYATIESFNVYSSGFSLDGFTSAIYLDPNFEIVKIGDIEYSNSQSSGV